MAMCAKCGTTLCQFEMKTGICQNCEALKRKLWPQHQMILTLFCKGFDDDEILAYLTEHRPELIKSIEQKAYDEGEHDGREDALENADPIDIFGEPPENEGYL